MNVKSVVRIVVLVVIIVIIVVAVVVSSRVPTKDIALIRSNYIFQHGREIELSGIIASTPIASNAIALKGGINRIISQSATEILTADIGAMEQIYSINFADRFIS